MAASTAIAKGFDTIAKCLSWDHERLDRLLAEVCQDVESRQMDEARTALADFASGLSRHIRIEEELVFPVFEMRTGLGGAPTLGMRSEHREILEAVGMMRGGLAQLDIEAFREGLVFLRQLLPGHNAKEEHILYPTTDRIFSDRERAAFVERVRKELGVAA
jgi:hemerythrin-like domain-containing protein